MKLLLRLQPVLLLALAASCAGQPSTSSTQILTNDSDPARPTFTAILPAEVAGQLSAGSLDAGIARKFLRVTRLDETTGTEGPPIFGVYRLSGTTLQFQPEFHLGAGARYRVTVQLPGQPTVSAVYTAAVPPPAADPPLVERVFPTADALPANLLKFYIHFSRPMRQSDTIFDHLHILDEHGEPVHDPWRRFPQWSDDGKRLTLWIHPGRVKRGVNLREEFGPVLVPGGKYTLQIEPTLADLAGQPLGKPFTKSFTATAEDHERVRVQTWKLAAPPAGGRDPLTITFPKPLDHALLQRLLTVRNSVGQNVAGTVEVSAGELTWLFRPAAAWTAQDYFVEVDGLLEDLAGNTPLRVFDSDMEADRATTAPILKLTFRPH